MQIVLLMKVYKCRRAWAEPDRKTDDKHSKTPQTGISNIPTWENLLDRKRNKSSQIQQQALDWDFLPFEQTEEGEEKRKMPQNVLHGGE